MSNNVQGPNNPGATCFEVGCGVLGWPRLERVVDRYGLVLLFEDPKSDDCVPLRLPTVPEGTLVAEVLETRPSRHMGDTLRGLYPSTPQVGERIVLGTGRFVVEESDVGWAVGLRPDDGRDWDWLDPRALNRVHDQTVRLVFES